MTWERCIFFWKDDIVSFILVGEASKSQLMKIRKILDADFDSEEWIEYKTELG